MADQLPWGSRSGERTAPPAKLSSTTRCQRAWGAGTLTWHRQRGVHSAGRAVEQVHHFLQVLQAKLQQQAGQQHAG